MILVDDGRLRLDEPVDHLLPELADRKVLRRLDGPLHDTVRAQRPITLRDLLTLRFGLGIIMTPSATFPIQRALNELQIVGFGPPDVSTPHDPEEWMRRLGTLPTMHQPGEGGVYRHDPEEWRRVRGPLPLMHQPGERWMYNTGSYVLGVLIARAAGQPLETFF